MFFLAILFYIMIYMAIYCDPVWKLFYFTGAYFAAGKVVWLKCREYVDTKMARN